uniref:Aminoglycoside phosphotransferase domain-containing protein n=1 Tax=Psilocybe cubensis TaxID=181762 RepID=A0A8H7XQ23_PSICU
METKSEGKEEDTFASSITFQVPWFPVRELSGFELFKYKLRRRLRNYTPDWKFLSFRSRTFVKAHRGVRYQEALSMEFIAQNTTIPVPRVLDVYTVNGIVHIVQERIPGRVLQIDWDHLSTEEKQSCMLQIKDFFTQLRSLKPPHPEHVQSVDGSGLSDNRIENYIWGPFSSHDEFHKFMHHDVFRQRPHHYPNLQEPLSKVQGKKYKSVFCHGDLGPHNIIWNDGKAVFIDWEMAGWFPEYWDYIRTHEARWWFTSWLDMFKEAVDRYDDEWDVQFAMKGYFAFR